MNAFFLLQTFHGDIMAVQRESAAVVGVPIMHTGSLPDVKDGNDLIFVYVPPTLAGSCLLMSRSEQLHLRSASLRGRILPLGLTVARPETVSLYDKLTGMWACAAPRRHGEDAGTIAIARHKVNDYESFHKVEIDQYQVPSDILALAHCCNRIIISIQNKDWKRLICEDITLMDAAVLLLGNEAIDMLSNALISDDPAVSDLQEWIGTGTKCGFALNALRHWARARSQTGTKRGFALNALRRWARARSQKDSKFQQSYQQIGTELDWMGSYRSIESLFSFSQACLSTMRASIEPKRDLCLVATARNEGLYLLEWIAYHRSIGIDEIVIYSNDNDDGSDELLEYLDSNRVIRWVKNIVANGGNAQMKAYNHAFNFDSYVLNFKWCLLIDLDEMFIMDRSLFSTINEFIEWHQTTPSDAIALSWVVYGSSGQGRWSDDFMLRRFDHPIRVDPTIKSIFKPRFYGRVNPHFPTDAKGERRTVRNSDRSLYRPHPGPLGMYGSATPSADFAWIAHFFYKSTEEYLMKWSRNRGDYAKIERPTNTVLTADFVSWFVDSLDAARIAAFPKNDTALDKLQQEYDHIISLPGVAHAWQRVKERYASRVTQIIPLFEDAPGILASGDKGRRLLDSLGPERNVVE